MRIVVANDGFSDAGGVQTYLDAVIGALQARGHTLAVAYCTDSGAKEVGATFRSLTGFVLSGPRAPDALSRLRQWSPDVCYSHNMNDLDVDRALMRMAPVVKFMHGYFGTCIGGLKRHAFPSSIACHRAFGGACAALYLPRRCGRLSPLALVREWRWAGQQHALLNQYAAIVVASQHMRREYVANGADTRRVHVNPLFPTRPLAAPSPVPDDPHVAFLGRMTDLKGGGLLVRAVRYAAGLLGRPIRLTMIGDGPQRSEWESLAARLGVPCAFTGWLHGDDRWVPLRDASVAALPSVWPEPFGLVGLEAGAAGVPAIAVDVGGVGEWLHDGVNGVAVPAPASPETFGAALASLLADRERLGVLRAGAHRVAREMTLDRHVRGLESLFEQTSATAVAS